MLPAPMKSHGVAHRFDGRIFAVISALQQSGDRIAGGTQWNRSPAWLARFTADFYRFTRTETLWIFFFYRFISADEVCLLLYPGLSPQRGDGPGFLCTNRKDCETKSQSINYHCAFVNFFPAPPCPPCVCACVCAHAG